MDDLILLPSGSKLFLTISLTVFLQTDISFTSLIYLHSITWMLNFVPSDGKLFLTYLKLTVYLHTAYDLVTHLIYLLYLHGCLIFVPSESKLFLTISLISIFTN